MVLTFLAKYLLYAPHLILAGVAFLLWRKRLYRSFPLFFVYALDETIQFPLFLAMIALPSITNQQYGIAYAVGLTLSITLRFGVIHEVFGQVFRNYEPISRFSRPIFRWGTVGIFLLGIGLALYTGGNSFNHLMLVLNLLERAASITQCVLLVGMFLFASYLRLSLRSHVFGIALGLGIYAAVSLATAALRSQFGPLGNTVLNYTVMTTYHVSVVIWLVYMWAPERSAQFAVKGVPDHDLDDWNKELQRLIQR